MTKISFFFSRFFSFVFKLMSEASFVLDKSMFLCFCFYYVGSSKNVYKYLKVFSIVYEYQNEFRIAVINNTNAAIDTLYINVEEKDFDITPQRTYRCVLAVSVNNWFAIDKDTAEGNLTLGGVVVLFNLCTECKFTRQVKYFFFQKQGIKILIF